MIKTPLATIGFSLLLSSALTIAADEKKAKLETDAAKESYSIGFSIGTQFKQGQYDDIDFEAIRAGMLDGYNSKEPQLSNEVMQQVTRERQQARIAKVREQQNKVAKANLEEAERFLDDNKKKPNIKVTESGLQYEILTESKGDLPSRNSRVKVHYSGTLVNGEKFDSSYDRGEPTEFAVTGVIKGWTEALLLMPVGSKWRLYIPPDLAYGMNSPTPKIPPNSLLVFDVELLEITGS